MHRFMIGLFLACCLNPYGNSLLADTLSANNSSNSADANILIESSKQFFEEFIAKAKPKPRGEFETKEEYQNRSLQTWDTDKILYFQVDPGEMDKNYSYDIDAQVLTVYCPIEKRRATEKDLYSGSSTGFPIRVLEDDRRLKGYTASNAFGKTVDVREYMFTDYLLNIRNISHFPAECFDSENMRLRFRLNLPPKKAELLSKSLRLVVGVKLPGFESSGMACIGIGDPTIDHPVDSSSFVYQIDAKVVSVLLRDSGSGDIYARCDIPNDVVARNPSIDNHLLSIFHAIGLDPNETPSMAIDISPRFEMSDAGTFSIVPSSKIRNSGIFSDFKDKATELKIYEEMRDWMETRGYIFEPDPGKADILVALFAKTAPNSEPNEQWSGDSSMTIVVSPKGGKNKVWQATMAIKTTQQDIRISAQSLFMLSSLKIPACKNPEKVLGANVGKTGLQMVPLTYDGEKTYPVVFSVTDGGPSYNAGIEIGDIITSIDGVETLNKSFAEIAHLVLGKPGTLCSLTIKRGADVKKFIVNRVEN